MKALRLVSAFVFAGMCLSMASCINSKNPVSDPETAKVDQNVLGAWRTTDKDGNVIDYHVAVAGDKLPGGLLRVISTTHKKTGGLPVPGKLFAFSSEVGNDRFLNVAVVDNAAMNKLEKTGWSAALVKSYSLIKYEVQGDTATLWPVARDVKLTDTSENVAKFLAAPENAGLFDAKSAIHYDRVK
jgi:hypothetical protein